MRKLIVKGKEAVGVRAIPGSGMAEKHAAEELIRYFGMMGIPEGDGLTVQVVIDESIDRDGFRIHIIDEDNLEIAGGNGRGVNYGVYNFLKKYAGVRFFMPDLETLGEGDIVVEKDYAFTPVFEFRKSDWKCCRDVDWSVKNGVNDMLEIPEEKGGCFRYAKGYFAHTMKKLAGTDSQPCMTDPEVLKKTIASVREILAREPKEVIVSVTQEDGFGRCRCAKCMAIVEEEGGENGGGWSGLFLRFVNAVAADIAEDYPDAVIDTFAYVYTTEPAKITRPLPNVCIRICAMPCCHSHAVNDPGCIGNRLFCETVEKWNKICSRIYIWEYSQNYHYYIPPYPDFATIRHTMRYYAEHGAKGMYPEGNPGSPRYSEFGELRCYLMAQLMWNPFMSAEEYYTHMDEFLAAFYGEGWRYVRAFLDSMCGMVGGHCLGGIHPSEYMRRDKLEVMADTYENWWNKAEEQAGERLENVKRARLQWEFLRLDLFPNEEEGRQFEKDVRSYGIHWLEDLKKLIENPPERYGWSPYTWYWKEHDPFGNKVDTGERPGV